MKEKRTGIAGWSWITALLLTLAIWAAPEGARAANGAFDTPNHAFTWYSKGPGTLHLSLQVSSYIDNKYWRCLKECTFYLKDENDNTINFLYVSETGTSNGRGAVQLKNYLASESHVYLANDYSNRKMSILSIANSG